MHGALYRAILAAVKRVLPRLLLLASACNDAPAIDLDAGDAGTMDAARPAPEAPLAPALPTEPAPLWPGIEYRDDCPFDQAHFPGTAGCARVGTECPADGWPADLPSDRAIVYVDDDASGGDGTRAAPYRTIYFAASQAPAGAIVAIATGRYDEVINIRRSDVTLWGACVDGTRLTSSEANDGQAHLYLGGERIAVRNLAIDAPERVGVLFDGEADFEDVVISGARVIGLIGNNGGSSTARRVVVRGTRALANGTLGYGVQINGGGSMRIEDAVIEHVQGLGISADQATALELARIVVHDVAGNGGDLGVGVWVANGTVATIEQLAVARTASRALFAQGAGSMVTAREVITQDSAGFQAIEGARLVLDLAQARRQLGTAFFARDPDTTVEVRDLILEDVTDGGPLLGDGVGVAIEGATAIFERVRIERSETAGVFASDGARIEVRDLIVRDTKPDLAGRGEGIAVTTGAIALFERVILERNREVSLIAADPGSSAEARDLLVLDTIPRSDGEGGPGVWSQIGGSITLARARIERSTFVGIAALQASIVANDVAVIEVVRAPCAETTCPEKAGGFGVAAHYGGTLAMDDFTIEAPAICGAVVGAASSAGVAPEVDLAHGVIARAPIGACVQVEGFDSARLREDVEYRDVEIPLQATSYSLPDALAFE